MIDALHAGEVVRFIRRDVLHQKLEKLIDYMALELDDGVLAVYDLDQITHRRYRGRLRR